MTNKLTRQVFAKLRRTGMKRNTANYYDYEFCKAVIFKDGYVNQEIYQRKIGAICEYLGL